MGPFETERLHLRCMQTDDSDALRTLIYADEDVWGAYSSIGSNPTELESRFVYHSHQPYNSPLGRLVVVLKDTGQVIGQVHLDPYVNDYGAVPGDPPSPCCAIEVELAFAFGKAYWGQGLAYEACRCLVEYAFGTLNLPRLVGAAMLENQRSVNLQKRLGYQVFRKTPANDGRACDDGWVTVLTNPVLSEVPVEAGPAPAIEQLRPAGAVEIIAYGKDDAIAFEHIYPNYEWHEGDKPVVDSYDERVRLGVTKIEGKRCDAAGRLTEHWLISYTETGALKEEWAIADGVGTHNIFPG